MLLLFYGADAWRKEQKLAQLTKRFFKEADPSRLNYVVKSGRELPEMELSALLMAAPFLARKRLVVLENFLSVQKSSTLKELRQLLYRLPEHLILVFKEEAPPTQKKNNETHALWEELKKLALVEEFKPLKGAQLRQALAKQAQTQGVMLDVGALTALSGITQGDLAWAEQELNKLAVYPSQNALSAVEVQKICASREEENLFALLDAVGDCQSKVAALYLDQVLRNHDVFFVLTQLRRHLRCILVQLWQEEAGLRALGLHPFQVQKIRTQARKWKATDLLELLHELGKLEGASKQGKSFSPTCALSYLLEQHFFKVHSSH